MVTRVLFGKDIFQRSHFVKGAREGGLDFEIGFGRGDEGRAGGYGGRFGGYNKSIISICFLVRIKAHLPRSHQGYRVYHPSAP
jgi:hypothetical protein